MSKNLKDDLVASMMKHLKENLEPHVIKGLRGQQTEEILRAIADWVYKREVGKDYFKHVKKLNESRAVDEDDQLDFMAELEKI